ncbi:MAG: tetratricopeptide repeat protein [Acidobacteriota bacterium]
MIRRVARTLAALTALALLGSQARAIPAPEARSRSFKLQTEGMRLYKDGLYEEAIDAFRQVVHINLNSFLAHYYLGASLVAARRYGEAIEPLKIALDLQPDYVQAHMSLGDAYLKLGDASEARAEYLRALDLQPNFAAAHDGLGRLLESTGKDEEAEQQYREALRINLAFAEAYTHLGDLYLRQERLDDAIDLFLKAISVKLDFSSAYTRLGVAYARRGQYDEAIAAARKSQSLSPYDPDPYVTLARIYLKLHSFRRAEAQVLSALAQDHDHPEAHLVLSDLKRAQGNFEAARMVLEELYERGIEDSQMRREVGRALRRVRAEAVTFAELSAAAGRAPADPGALIALARFISARGSHRRAAGLLERAAGMVAGDDTGVDAGTTEEGAAAPPESQAASVGGAAAPGAPPPSTAEIRFEAGMELLAGRLFARAAALFEELAAGGSEGTTDPELGSAALFNLGVARASLGLHEEAARSFRAFLGTHPDDPRARLYLGNAYLRLGRTEEARAAYSAYLRRAGSAPEVREVEEILRAREPPPDTPSRDEVP